MVDFITVCIVMYCVYTQCLVSEAVTSPSGIKVLVAELPDVDPKALGEAAASLVTQLGDSAAVLLATRPSSGAGSANFIATFSPQVCVCACVRVRVCMSGLACCCPAMHDSGRHVIDTHAGVNKVCKQGR